MKENGKYRLLMAAYYMIICLIFSFAAMYLTSEGFSSWEIGILISVSCLAGGILQAAAGRLADRDPRWSWKKQLIMYSITAAAIAALRMVIRSRVLEGISYGLLIVLTLVMMPLVNSACFYYVDCGKKVDFGLARGIGSVSYAAASFMLGRLAGARGDHILVVCGFAAFILMLAAVIIMPYYGYVTDARAEQTETDTRGLAGRYPVFIVMAAAITLALVFSNMISTYMFNIMEDVGGGPDSMGVALAIAGVSEMPALFLYSRIQERTGLSSAMLITAACFFFVLRGFLFMEASGVMMIYFVQLLQSVSYGLITAAKANYAHEALPAEENNTGQAVMSMTDSFSIVAGSLIGGLLLSGGGTDLMLQAGTALAAAGMIVAFIAARKGKKEGNINGKR